MKSNRNTIATIATAAVALIAGTTTSDAANRTLVLLQENSNGKSYLDGALTGAAQFAVDSLIDTFVESGEAFKFESLARGRYQKFVNLSDTNCTRAKLLSTLVAETKAGRTIDLAILGHGNDNLLGLHGDETLTGVTTEIVTSKTGIPTRITHPGNLRSLLTDARATEGSTFKFNLRLVHMCNCFGGTLNDDWLAIGAKVSVGAPRMDWMPEPMNTFFWDDFVKNDKPVGKAAADSLAATKPLWLLAPTYLDEDPEIGLNKIDETQQLVSGNRDLIFRDEFQMALNEQRTFTIMANRVNTLPQVYVGTGQRYTFSATGSWTDGGIFSPTDTANGHSGGIGLRYPQFNVMSLVGERFAHPSTSGLNFIFNSGFKIGTSHARTFGSPGFLNLFSNDNLLAYGDNKGAVSVTIKRVAP